ncbi:Helix-turn-helix [Serratia ficaria]|uniref:helix-turn-helix domain-containing protein n=1 Tax=Serratia ficaria TaxID=61651 RepID=UPI002178BFEB|nr:helix-turn-helix transcriptional regulator [Serratia ficaria]CAI1246352.1 Helix-turn-helix [Serratia ficaria]CAI2030551.1 Helix-turn-helix [Serratia ficaria]CAI2528258.1 Helix-turn-helix [Serratia ficaria]CAI2540234.1 Helix-turn-helix [Serratia ficaria]CAI2794190.1 Helix-turn-helix [Serratia ficaria]
MKTRDEQTTQLIGLRLQQKRNHAGKSVIDVQNETGIPRSTLQNYEAGIRQAPLGVIRKLASIYRTSAAYLAGLTDYEGDGDALAFSTADPLLVGKKTTIEDPLAFNSAMLASKGLSPAKLALIQSPDDLLEEVPRGANVLIDTSVNEVTSTDIYAFKDQRGNIVIRGARQEIGKSGFIIYATKDVHFPPTHITGVNENISVFGRVVFVGVWR